MKSTKHVAYLTVGEDINSPLLRRQVLELLCEIKRQNPDLQITLFSFLAFYTILNHREGLRQAREFLEPFGIRLRIIPSFVPWPIPHFKFQKTDVGYRPHAIWTKAAARLLGFVVWPVMGYYYFLHGVRVFHCRSYPPAYAAILFKKFFSKTKVIFDPRSDFPEENVTVGNWKDGDKNFLFWKSAEEKILKSADATACIAPSYLRAYKAICPDSNYFLVPNNVDCKKFQRIEANRGYIRKKLGIHDDELVFCYLGGMTSKGWHRADVYARVCETLVQAKIECRFLFIVPPHSSDLLRQKLSQDVCSNFAIIVNLPFEDVPSYLAAADYGLMFMHRSKIAVGTKIGEYLAAGLPVIVNKNCIGASDLIYERQIGIIVGMGLGDLDASQDLGGLRLLKKGTELSKWSASVSKIAKTYFDNSTIAARYYEQYGIVNA